MIAERLGPRLVLSQLVADRSELPQRIEWMREQVEVQGMRIVDRAPEPTIRRSIYGWRIDWDIEVER